MRAGSPGGSPRVDLDRLQPDGTLQVSPVGFHWNRDTGTIDIDEPGADDPAIVRIRPSRIIALGVEEQGLEPHEVVPGARSVTRD